MNIMDLLNKNDIEFFSYSENIDATTAMGKAMLQIMGTFSELERNIIIDNVKMGMNQRAKEGKWNGGSVLGYSSKEKKLEINDREANLVRHIFNLYIGGKGFKAIANQLNHEGYTTKRNAKFSINSIRQIITNPMYVGYIRFNHYENWNEKRRAGKGQNVILVKGEHQPIISEEIWEKTLVKFEQKSNKPTKVFHGHFPLTTLLRCPKCNQGMIGHRVKDKNTNEYRRYYQCGDFHYKGSAVCNSNLVRADDVEKFVFDKLGEVTSNPILLESLVGKVNSKIVDVKKPLLDQQANISSQLKQVEKNIKKFLSLIEKTDSPPTSLLDKIRELDHEKNKLNEIQKSVEFKLNEPVIKEASAEKIQEVLKTFSSILPTIPVEKQKVFLHSIISKITIYEGNSPTERSVKAIELYFDASYNKNFVLTYGTVHPS